MARKETAMRFFTIATFAISITLYIAGCSSSPTGMQPAGAVGEPVVVLPGSSMVATNMTGVYAFGEPPRGFSAMTASDSDLAMYGFPPRPNRANAVAVAKWQAFVLRKHVRIIPQLTATSVYHGPGRTLSERKIDESHVESSDSIWSGYAVIDTSNPFITAANQVNGTYTLPKAQCISMGGDNAPGVHWASEWVGIDGYKVSSDVWQAGTDAVVNCPGDHESYYAWVEWFPAATQVISNVEVRPGDVISVAVWWNATFLGGRGFMVFENETTFKTVTITMAPPPHVTLTGNTAEWIIERPSFGTAAHPEPTSLADYENSFWKFAIALGLSAEAYFPGGIPTGTLYHLTMTEDGQNVSGVSVPDSTVPWQMLFLYDPPTSPQ